MRRRDFIRMAAAGAAASSTSANAQQKNLPVVGFVNTQSARDRGHLVAAFQRGLDSFGQDVSVEYHWAEGSTERLAVLCADLVRRQVSVIVATGGFVSGLAAKRATTTIPIVFTSGSDPVRIGLVSNFNRPGGNITGISFFITELEQKRVELLREIMPGVKSIGMLVNPKSRTAENSIANVQTAARALNIDLQVHKAGIPREIEQAFDALSRSHKDALVVHADPYFLDRRAQIVGLAARHRIPAIYFVREFAIGGGLISYGTSQPDAYYQAGLYAARILKGENPGDLPVMQPTKFELVINLKAARALGFAVPPTLLARADEVIE
jgi:putative ABC transport system substrate-binding protein